MMTNSELIEKLQKLPGDALVHTYNQRGNGSSMPDLVSVKGWGPEGHQTYIELAFKV